MQVERKVSTTGDSARLPIATVSHTLSDPMRQRLRSFAFESRISESAILEQALFDLFESASPDELVDRLRSLGRGLRRK